MPPSTPKSKATPKLPSSVSTSILFDSPALHALKRAQLVQLCKRHNVKASGKNVELVERLKRCAEAMKMGVEVDVSPYKGGMGGEEGEEDYEDVEEGGSPCKGRGVQRMGVVEEGDEDEDEDEEDGEKENEDPFAAASLKSSKLLKSVSGTVNEQGELANATGSSKSSITSSLKSFASTFGFKSTINPFAPTHALKRSNVASVSSTNTAVTNITESVPDPIVTVTPLSPTSTSAPGFDFDTSMDRPVPGMGGLLHVGPAEGGGTIRLVTPPKKRFSIAEEDYDDDNKLTHGRAGNATPGRMSLGGFPSSVRDSLPRLAPYRTTFEIMPPTPGWKGVWPPVSPVREDDGEEEEEAERMYPSLKDVQDDVDMSLDVELVDEPAQVSTKLGENAPAPVSNGPAAQTSSTLAPPTASTAFVFGSPNPRHSTTAKDFTNVASSVLAEMNARLGGGGSGVPGIDVNLIQARLQQGGTGASSSKMSKSEILNYQFGGAKGFATNPTNTGAVDKDSVKYKFDRAHEKAFEKMEGIDAYLAKRASREALVVVGKKRKSDVLGTEMGKGKNVAGKKKNALPGAFGEEEEEEEEENQEPEAKRVRVSSFKGDGKGNAPAITPAAAATATAAATTKPKVSIAQNLKDIKSEADRLRKERESIKRALDIKKARRRSSKGLGVGGHGSALLAVGAKTPVRKSGGVGTAGGGGSRFGVGGVLASARKIVRSVWGRGAGAAERKGSTLMKPTSASVAKAVAGSGPGTSTGAGGSVGVTTGKRISSLSAPKLPPKPSSTTSASNASGPSTNVVSRASSIARPHSKSSTLGIGQPPVPPKSGTTASTGPTRTASVASSLRSRTTSFGFGMRKASGASASGTATKVGSTASRASSATTTTTIGSRLFAPTASSLAKMKEKSANGGASPTKIPRSVGSAAGLGTGVKSGSIPGSGIPSKPKSTSIFSTPLPLKLQGVSGADKENGAKGNEAGAKMTMNPITGVLSPSNSTQANSQEPKAPSLSRKPRISRGKIIAKLDAQRAASSDGPEAAKGATTTTTTAATAKTPTIARTPRASALALSAKKQKLRARSSIGAARRGPKAALGLGAGGGDASAGVGAGGVLMSAKKRARRSEVVRRKTEKVGKLDLGVAVSEAAGDGEWKGVAMDVEVDA